MVPSDRRTVGLAALLAVAAGCAGDTHADAGAAGAASAAIDREALLRRHDVHAASIDTTAPLTVGNGEFGFTADVTGLQTLNESYTNPPLQTMSHWGWHRVPPALAGGVDLSSYEYERVTVANHTAHYATNCTPTPAYEYLRANPHRINLGRVFLRRLKPADGSPGAAIAASDIAAIDQTLHLWNGTLGSAFTLDSHRVTVETAVHPTKDALAVKICSALVQQAALGLGIAFPYPQTSFAGGTDWHLPDRHSSSLVLPAAQGEGTLNHTMDNTTYFVRVKAAMAATTSSGSSAFAAAAAAAAATTQEDVAPTLSKGSAPHDWTIAPPRAAVDPGNSNSGNSGIGREEGGNDCLQVTLWFAKQQEDAGQEERQAAAAAQKADAAADAAANDDAGAQPPSSAIPSVSEVLAASAEHWAAAWRSGAALDLSGSTAAGAAELERRVVLSQYILMSQEAGSNPPQETGLMTNSWYGKFHLEMRWHHQFHFLLWGRPAFAQRSDGYFDAVREPAREFTRERQGYTGVRWPKMVGPPEEMMWSAQQAGTPEPFFWYDGPSGAGPWILWQQPHPIAFAEMTYRQEPTAATIARYNQTVHDTADFMADFVLQAPPVPSNDPLEMAGGGGGSGGGGSSCYSLGPPMYTAEIESDQGRPAFVARDGTFELAYWRFGLSLANKWRARLGLLPEPQWVQAERGLCKPLPRPLNGTGPLVYYPYSNSTVDEPFAAGYAVQLFANAIVPGENHGVNATVMAETVRQSLHALDITRLPWCSDPPLYAMSAARLGMIDLAAEFLLQPNATPGGTMRYLSSGHCQIKGFLPVYTPGNGALLSAVAMLAGGWDGGPEAVADRFPAGFVVRAENFTRMF